MKEVVKISNKTVRKNEKFLMTWFGGINGKLQKTNRGYFLNGENISNNDAAAWLKDNRVKPKIWRWKKSPVLNQKGEWEHMNQKGDFKKRPETNKA